MIRSQMHCKIRVMNSQTYFDVCHNISDPRVELMRIDESLGELLFSS